MAHVTAITIAGARKVKKGRGKGGKALKTDGGNAPLGRRN